MDSARFDALSMRMPTRQYEDQREDHLTQMGGGRRPQLLAHTVITITSLLIFLLIPLTLNTVVPHSFRASNHTFVDPLQPYWGVVYGITAPILLIFIYVTAFGLRGFDVRRWMVLNLLLWMLWHAMVNADGTDHSPWKGWLGFDYDTNTYWQEMTVSAIPGSLCLLYIESIVTSILYICRPKARYSIVYNIIWFCIYVWILNGIQSFCYSAKYYMTDTVWWYDPVDSLISITSILAWILWILHFLFTLVMSAVIPLCTRKRKDPAIETSLFPVGKMWLVVIYGLVPMVLIIPYISVPLVQFLFTNFSEQMLDLMEWVASMRGSGGGDSAWIMELGLKFMGNRDYFMLYLPIVITFLTVICFPVFYRPLLILLSCGRVCASSGKRSWFSQSPPPSYPGAQLVDEKKVPPS